MRPKSVPKAETSALTVTNSSRQQTCTQHWTTGDTINIESMRCEQWTCRQNCNSFTIIESIGCGIEEASKEGLNIPQWNVTDSLGSVGFANKVCKGCVSDGTLAGSVHVA
eukprot:4220462-Amphidinium_carterae.1